MNIKFPSLKWLNKKYIDAKVEKNKYLLKATFLYRANFLVQYPISDQQSVIQEITQIEWNQEVELLKLSQVYFKIFATSSNFISKNQVTLQICLLNDSETNLLIEKQFQFGNDQLKNDWLKINWHPST